MKPLEEYLKSDAAKTFKGRLRKRDARNLARAYTRIRPLQNDANRATIKAHLDGFLDMRTHPVIAELLSSRYSGVESMVQIGPMAAEADHWRLSAAITLWTKGQKDSAKQIATSLMRDAQSQEIRIRAEDLVTHGRIAPRFTTFQTTSPEVRWLASFPDGKTLLIAARAPKVSFLQNKNGKVLRLVSREHNIDAIALRADGKMWASSDNRGEIFIHTTGKETSSSIKLTGHKKAVRALTFSDDNRFLASAGLDATSRIWDISQKEQIHQFTTQRGLRAIVFFPDGKHIAAGGFGHKIYVWRLGTEEAVHTYDGHTYGIRALAVSADSKRILSASDDMTIRLWELGKPEAIATLHGHSSLVTNVTFIDDDKKALSSSMDGTLRIWDLKSNKTVGEVSLNEDGINTFSISKDGKTIYAGGRKGNIFVVNRSDIKLKK
jgi:WD40 repeat protein